MTYFSRFNTQGLLKPSRSFYPYLALYSCQDEAVGLTDYSGNFFQATLFSGSGSRNPFLQNSFGNSMIGQLGAGQDALLGSGGVEFSHDGIALVSYKRSVHDVLLKVTDAITIDCITSGDHTGTIVSFGETAVGESNNTLYEVFLSSASGPGMRWEVGSGPTLIEFTDVNNVLPSRTIQHLTVTRSAGSDPVVKIYINGSLTATSAAFVGSSPTGGTTSRLKVGNGNTPSSVFLNDTTLMSLKIIASELTADQVKHEHNVTLGYTFGRLL